MSVNQRIPLAETMSLILPEMAARLHTLKAH